MIIIADGAPDTWSRRLVYVFYGRHLTAAPDWPLFSYVLAGAGVGVEELSGYIKFSLALVCFKNAPGGYPETKMTRFCIRGDTGGECAGRPAGDACETACSSHNTWRGNRDTI